MLLHLAECENANATSVASIIEKQFLQIKATCHCEGVARSNLMRKNTIQ